MTWLALRGLPWKLIGFAALGLALAGAVVALKLERAKSADLAYRLTVCQNLREADHAAYEAAQEAAKAANVSEVKQKEQKQETNNAKAVSNLRSDLERIRRELRAPAGAAKGDPGSAGPSQADNPRGTSDPACLHLTPEERLRGAEDEARHAELVNLVKQAQRLLNE